MWLHHVEAVGAALRYSALDGLRPPVVMVTGMGLPAVETYLPALAGSALRRRRLLFVDPFASGYMQEKTPGLSRMPPDHTVARIC